ncbi:MAG: polyprenyl synthetase family protein [Candidatus Binatia bacterium]
MSDAAKDEMRGRIQAPDLALAEALQLVEAQLAGQVRSREALLGNIASYLIGSGGKRVRPAVTLLVFRACGGRELRDIVDIATALELIHSASLLHDDIIDGSGVRRGKDSAFRKYGLASTLVAGDFVFSRAFQLCARFEQKLINWAAEACVSLTEGEIMQARFRHNPSVTLADYLEIISRKTASIFQQGARTAAYVAGAAEPTVEAMARCGFNVGMAFQMVDDVLDVAGSAARLGKPIGIDLRDGNPSLPIVLAIRRDPEVARVFEQAAPSAGDIHTALTRVERSGVLSEVRQLAAQYGGRARESVDVLPPSPDRERLRLLIDQLLERGE